jgi:hypothetical protein
MKILSRKRIKSKSAIKMRTYFVLLIFILLLIVFLLVIFLSIFLFFRRAVSGEGPRRSSRLMPATHALLRLHERQVGIVGSPCWTRGRRVERRVRIGGNQARAGKDRDQAELSLELLSV